RKAVRDMERTMMRRRRFLRGVSIEISLSIHKPTSVRLGWSAGASAEIHDTSMTIMSALGYGVEPRRSIQREAMMSLPRLNGRLVLPPAPTAMYYLPSTAYARTSRHGWIE